MPEKASSWPGAPANVGNAGWTAEIVSDQLVERGRIEEAESIIQEALTAARTVGDTLLVG